MTRLFVALGFSVALATALAGLLRPWTNWDNSTATYIADLILRGGAPYLDAWNTKAPGVYFAYALSILLFGKSAPALRLFDFLWQLATALVLARIVRRLDSRPAVPWIAASSYLLFFYLQGYWNWAQADGFLNLPLALGALSAARALETDRWWHWAGAAAGTGAALLFKLPLGLFGLALIAAACLVRPRSWLTAGRRLTALAVGVLIPVGACAAFLMARGAWQEFLRVQFTLAPQMVESFHRIVPLRCLLSTLAAPPLYPIYLALAAAAVVRVWRAHSGESLKLGPLSALVLAWLTAALVTFFLHGVYATYHLMPSFAPAAILGAAPLADLLERRLAPASRLARPFAAVLLVGFLSLPVYRLAEQLLLAKDFLAGRVPIRYRDLGERIRACTRPDEPIFVWGNAPVIYLYAQRPCASRFIISYGLATPWAGLDYRAQFLRELRERPPRFFVLLRDLPPSPCSGRDLSSFEAFDRFAELKAIVHSEFRRESETSDYILYERVGGASR
jgi:4-amino-4-deoxy-L-arabinose transferase-like glycosyltransferase